MFLCKLKTSAAALVTIGVLAAGLTTPALADPPADKSKPTKPAKPAKPEKPAKPDGKKLPSVQGTIKSVDADKGSVTVTTVNKKSGTVEETVTLAKDAQVLVDGTDAKLADLKPGYPVNLKMTQDKSAAVGIAAEGPTLAGELKDVDATKRTIKVLVTRTDPTDKTKTATEEKSIAVAETAKVAVQGQKKATLADLKVGEKVSVRLSAAGDKVFAIQSPAKRAADGTKKPAKPAKPDKAKPHK